MISVRGCRRLNDRSTLLARMLFADRSCRHWFLFVSDATGTDRRLEVTGCVGREWLVAAGAPRAKSGTRLPVSTWKHARRRSGRETEDISTNPSHKCVRAAFSVRALSPKQDGLYRRVICEVHLPSVPRQITNERNGGHGLNLCPRFNKHF